MSCEVEVSSPKIWGETLQGVTAIYFILFLFIYLFIYYYFFFSEKTLWGAPYQDLLQQFIVSQLEP